ncbi:MAG TPA: hypothetical protein H9722_04540 [Candidatus Mediterraneibacter pullistercoris]|nr:hypothetical protein [Candidatus Mediterraneibacter pullistercoris]
MNRDVSSGAHPCSAVRKGSSVCGEILPAETLPAGIICRPDHMRKG